MNPTTWDETAQRRPPERTPVGEVMTPSSVSIRADATLEEAVAFLVDSGFSAAPVIDDAGRPVGVISRSDVVVYDRERLLLPAAAPYYFESADELAAIVSEERAAARVADVMTPAIFSVTPDLMLGEVAGHLTDLHVHRLFVVDDSGVLVGVVTALDLLRHLRPQALAAAEGASR